MVVVSFCLPRRRERLKSGWGIYERIH